MSLRNVEVKSPKGAPPQGVPPAGRVSAAVLIVLSAILGIAISICAWKGVGLLRERMSRESRYDALIVDAAMRNGVDPCLLKAVVWKESRFDRDTLGGKGEIGLMQIMPGAAVADWEKAHRTGKLMRGALTEPDLNLEIGSWYLARALRNWQDYRDKEILALSEYNAGPQRANLWKPAMPDGNAFALIDIASTRTYIKEILERRDHYRETWNWKKAAKRK